MTYILPIWINETIGSSLSALRIVQHENCLKRTEHLNYFKLDWKQTSWFVLEGTGYNMCGDILSFLSLVTLVC